MANGVQPDGVRYCIWRSRSLCAIAVMVAMFEIPIDVAQLPDAWLKQFGTIHATVGDYPDPVQLVMSNRCYVEQFTPTI